MSVSHGRGLARGVFLSPPPSRSFARAPAITSRRISPILLLLLPAALWAAQPWPTPTINLSAPGAPTCIDPQDGFTCSANVNVSWSMPQVDCQAPDCHIWAVRADGRIVAVVTPEYLQDGTNSTARFKYGCMAATFDLKNGFQGQSLTAYVDDMTSLTQLPAETDGSNAAPMTPRRTRAS